MSFAYLEGQEEEALMFFEKRLMIARDEEERQMLRQLVEQLRAVLRSRGMTVPDYSNRGLSLMAV